MNARTVILAAGEGTRMKSARSKVLHELFGKPMIGYCLEAARKSGIGEILVVAGRNRAELQRHFGKTAKIVFQKERLGTGHALMTCWPALKSFKGDLLVLVGDAPLIRPETLRDFYRRHRADGAHASILTAELADPQAYGRIIRDVRGDVQGIREYLDASESEREVREVNSGIYFFNSREVFETLKSVRPSNRKKEYYLTDAVELLVKKGAVVKAYPLASGEELLGINNRRDLAEATGVIWKRNLERHFENGVTIVSPENTYIESGVEIGSDTVVYPFTYIESGVRIGQHCQIGPFCKIRSGSSVKNHSCVGSFVEVVRSSIGEKTNVKHLTYLGDAQVGNGVNIGAGTITANYDGVNKNRTRIGDGAFIGSDTVLVAPVSVGSKSRTGAGSVVLKGKNVPAGATAVGAPARILQKGKRGGKKN